jgi:hypothetical protein
VAAPAAQESSEVAQLRALEMLAAGAMRAALALRGLFGTDPRWVRMASNAARELARGFGLAVPAHFSTAALALREGLLAGLRTVFIVGVCVCVQWCCCAAAGSTSAAVWLCWAGRFEKWAEPA